MPSKKYTPSHEWLLLDGDVVSVGVTDYAQQQLGDVVFVELPELGANTASGDEMVVIESVKAAGEVEAPIGGIVVAVNETLLDDPAGVNEDPEGAAWLFKLKVTDASVLNAFMDRDSYQEYLGENE